MNLPTLQWDLAWPWLVVGNAYANWPAGHTVCRSNRFAGNQFLGCFFPRPLLLHPRYLTHRTHPPNSWWRVLWARFSSKTVNLVTLSRHIPFFSAVQMVAHAGDPCIACRIAGVFTWLTIPNRFPPRRLWWCSPIITAIWMPAATRMRPWHWNQSSRLPTRP